MNYTCVYRQKQEIFVGMLRKCNYSAIVADLTITMLFMARKL